VGRQPHFSASTIQRVPDSILLGVHCLPTAISPHKHIGENRPVRLLIFTSLARTFLVCCHDNASDNADVAIDAHSQLIEVLLPVRRRRMRDEKAMCCAFVMKSPVGSG